MGDPANILNKGYSITLFNNKPVKDIKNVRNDDVIETKLANGKLFSKINGISEN